MTKKLRIPSHWIVVGSAWMSRIVTALLQVISIRILTSGLGADSYSVYALMVGLSVWFMLTDIGIATASQNHISTARATETAYEGQIVALYCISLVVGIVLMIGAWFVAPVLSDWLMVKYVTIPEPEKIRALRIMAMATIVLATTGVVYKVWYAEQKGYLTHLVQLASAVAGFLLVVALLRMDLENPLAASLWAYFGCNALGPLYFVLARIARSWREIFKVKLAELTPVFIQGLKFWGYSLMAALVLQVDYIVIGYLLKPEDVVIYSIYMRIFGLGFFVYTSVLNALWPKFSEHAVRSEFQIIKAEALKCISVGLVFVLIFTLGIFFEGDLLIKFISPSIPINAPLLFVGALGFYYIMRVWTDTLAVVLQSMGHISVFYLVLPAQAVISVAAQYTSVKWLGLSGIPIGLTVSFLCTTCWMLPIAAWKKLNLGKTPS